MSQPTALSVLGRLVAKLHLAEVPYMLVGSFASSMHGEPRSTQDIDIVIDPDIPSLERLLNLLPEEEYYCDADAARLAWRRKSQVNIIDMAAVWKVDLIFKKSTAHAASSFDRRTTGRVGDLTVVVESAEDTIISKLRWAKLGGGSERQIRDVAGVVKVRGDDLDYDYLRMWLARLDLDALWRRASPESSGGPSGSCGPESSDH